MPTCHPDTGAGGAGTPLLVLFLVILLPWGAGCGYQPSGLGSLPPDLQRLHLAALKNNTFRPGLPGLVGGAILRQLQQDGRIRVAPQESADAVLAGTITAYQNIPVAFDQSDIGQRFRVRLVMSMQLTGRGTEKVLLREEVYGEAYYTAGQEVTETRTAEQDAGFRAAQDLAVRVVERLLEGL
jgi:outer membrane lipopolysaccharide assembly protein LptE/RlpB